MLKIAYADVAVVAQQATHLLRRMAVVNVQVSSARFLRVANCAFSVLGGKKLFVSAEGNAVSCAERVVFRQTWVCFPPLSGVLCAVHKVVSAPCVMTLRRADFAVHGVAVYSVAAAVELGQRLRSFAARAALSVRQIEWWSRHFFLPVRGSTLSVLLPARQEG